jgi:endo-1,3(4)-beta-glucanase
MNIKLTRRNASITLAIIVIGIIIIFSIFVRSSQHTALNGSSTFTVSPEILKQASSVPPFMRIREGLIPATNRWFSPLIFSEAQTIYAYPFSYKTDGEGFEVGVPRITSQEKAIFGIHPADIFVDLSTNSHEVDRYDDISVDNLFKNGAEEDVATVTITQGHPYIYIQANKDLAINVEPANIEDIEWFSDNSTILFTANSQRYGIVAESVKQDSETSFSIEITKGDSATLLAIPENTSSVEEYVDGARNKLKSAFIEANKLTATFETVYKLELKEDKESILGSLPHHNPNQTDSELGSFDTLYGPLVMRKGRGFTYEYPIRSISTELDLSNISAEQRTNIKTYLTEDSKILTLDKTDSYFGAKELYRAANLLQLAHQLDDQEVAKRVQEKLKAAFVVWFSPQDRRSNRYFYYDNTLKGVIGVKSSFGSEEFNDHHFHYGYFIYAASILADHDPDFLSKYKKYVDLLVADIAAPEGTEGFPPLRAYDRFTGHSWASGYGDFADGNNQESSSEATNAWAAVYNWARVSGNTKLQETAQWLYANEVESTKEYWLRDQRQREGFSSFNYPFVSLVWQGKRDFATFFSPRPQAALGIQLIPMSPAHVYLNETEIQKNISATLENQSSFSGQFGDYLVMYEALTDPDSALRHAENLGNRSIDDANSYSYLYAWLYSQSTKITDQ